MNFDFLRFESKLLRLLLGATFVIEATILLLRWTEPGWSPDRWAKSLEALPSALSGGTLVLVLALFAALAGTRVLDGISLVVGLLLSLARRLLKPERTPTLLLEPIEIARRIILTHKPAVREYHKLRGIGYAESAKHHEFLAGALDQRIDDVEALVNGASAREWDVITSIINFGTIIQEQAATDRLNERIATLKGFWIVLSLSVILVLDLLGWNAASLMVVGVLVLAMAAAVVAFGSAKREAAHHWVYLIYDSVGQFSAGAAEAGDSA